MVYFKVLLNDKRLKSDNVYPVVVRVTYNRKNTTFNSGIRLDKKYWDETNSKVKHNINNAQILNKTITDFYAKVQKAALTLADDGNFSFEALKNVLEKKVKAVEEIKREQTFKEFAEKLISDLLAINKAGNAIIYRTATNKFLSYVNCQELKFIDINYILLDGFKNQLIKDKLKPNSISNYFRTLRAIYNKAIKVKLIDRSCYPFLDITIKTERTAKRAVSKASIYRLLKRPVPSNIPEIMLWLKDEKMIVEVDSAGYYITNFGALASAQNLNEFDSLSRKTIRVIKYEGKSKSAGSKEYPGSKGYAIGFEGLIEFIKSLLPGSEIIKHALREETSVYPEIALREIIANALIHQDFTVRGSGPMIEIFEDRIEISNPGRLLPSKKIDRLIRTSPESRNEVLAAAFRRYNICEERGSGFEKSVRAVELYGLPPLKFIETENSFKVIMYSPKKFADMSLQERIDACYQHAVVQYYANEGMTNTSLRQRFRMSDKQASQISRLIRESIDAGRIKSKDPDNDSRKFTIYWPYWA